MLGLMEQIRLIIIDQHKGVRNALRVRLRSAPNLVIVGSVDADEATRLTQSDLPPDVALLGLSGRNDDLGYMVALVKRLWSISSAVRRPQRRRPRPRKTCLRLAMCASMVEGHAA